MNELKGNAIVVVVPHTSFIDGFIGKWVISKFGWDFRFICAPWLLKNKFWKLCLSFCNPMPAGVHLLQNVEKEFSKNNDLKIAICPEGQLAPTDKWSESFYHMAVRSNVPILLVTFSYKTKIVEIVKKYNIDDTEMISAKSCLKSMLQYIDPQYGYTYGKYPDKYLLPTKNIHNKKINKK